MEGVIWRWRVDDGQEVGCAMDTENPVLGVAVSHNS